MADIKSAKLLNLKGLLFCLVGLLASAALLLDNPNPKTLILLAVSIWAFARAYYFAFYVIEHYIDGAYKFAGLLDFFQYLLAKRNSRDAERL